MIKTVAAALALAVLGPPLPVHAAPMLAWEPCGEGSGMECADLEVPLDPTRPEGRTITLKVARLPAAGTRRGSVLVNFGGPTGQQIRLMRDFARDAFAGLRRTMDVVVWDPRGQPDGGSAPHSPCDWRKLAAREIPSFPASRARFDRLARKNLAIASQCRDKDPVLFDHMDSATNAHDMEAIRRALGEDRLNLHMTSYGGVYGAAYARLFPGRVRAMYLDGILAHGGRDWDRELRNMARDNEHTMRRFFEAAGPRMERRWRNLVAAAERSPIPAPESGARYNGQHLQNLGLGMAGRRRWDELKQAIKDTEEGDASGFAPQGLNPYPVLGTTTVTECLDFPTYTEYADAVRARQRLRRIAPNTGAPIVNSLLLCQGWPVPPPNPPRPLPKGLPPLLGAGTWTDFAATDRVVRLARGSASIYQDGPGHGLYASGNECVIRHADRYLTDLELPPPRARC